MSSRYNPPEKPLEPLDAWQVSRLKARLGDVAGCGCGLIVLGVIATVVILGATAGPDFGSEEITVEEAALLFDVGYIADMSSDPIDPAQELAYRTPLPGGDELQYVYEPAEGPYIYTALWVGDDSSQVAGKYREYSTHIVEFGGDEVTLMELAGACDWGLGSQCGVYFYQGGPAGNYFFAHKGNVALFIQILNIYWETAEDLDAIFLPYLENLEAGLE